MSNGQRHCQEMSWLHLHVYHAHHMYQNEVWLKAKKEWWFWKCEFPLGFRTRFVNLIEGKYKVNRYRMCVCAISYWNLFSYLNVQVTNALLSKIEVKTLNVGTVLNKASWHPFPKKTKAGGKEKEEIEKYSAENCEAKPVDLTMKFLAG